MEATCLSCGSLRRGAEHKCAKCGGLFGLKPDFKYRDSVGENFPNIKKWIDLGEVVTPILKKGDAYFKLDYFSPTFSYKDRGSKALISWLSGIRSDMNVTAVNEDSSGNAGASIAAYGSVAGFEVNIFVPEKTSKAKIDQISSYGAKIIKVQGSREDVQEAAEASPGVYASHVKMPEFRDGIRSLSYEIFKQFGGKVPDNIFVPVSAGTLLLGLHSGLNHLYESGEIKEIPNLVAVQTEQVSPLCAKISNRYFDPGKKVTSVADALVSMKPPLLDEMVKVMQDGVCITVSEEEIVSARGELSRSGMYAEYSSATVYAAFKKKKFEGMSLLVLTGNGLKNQAL